MSAPHPFAGGGGGTTYERRVAILLAVDLVCARTNPLSGAVNSIQLQSGPAGLDDLEVGLERLDGTEVVVHLQCRHRQPLTGTNAKFCELLTAAWAAVAAARSEYASGQRFLGLAVDEASPGWRSLARLCRLAVESPTSSKFFDVVARHGGDVAARLGHCRTASGLGDDELHSTLAAFKVVATSLGSPQADDAVEIINRLQVLWIPPDPRSALTVVEGLLALITDRAERGGTIDLAAIQAALAGRLPTGLAANTRRARLERLAEAGLARVGTRLQLLGLDPTEAAAIALTALAAAPLDLDGPTVVLEGAMGVGKTTELERQHRTAVLAAIEDPNRPVPVLVHARDLTASIPEVVTTATAGLGDPTRVGVHLCIDGLDEAGVTVEDVLLRVADAPVRWPGTRIVIATRPQPYPPAASVISVGELSPKATEELIWAIEPEATKHLPGRSELDELLRRPLYAIGYALDARAGKYGAIQPANLVAAVGRRAVRDLDMSDEATFRVLPRLACDLIDAGGRPVELATLGLSALHAERLIRSRIVQVTNQAVSFQLAALTEWFAATALLGDTDALDRATRSPDAAYHWRYALVQALIQAGESDVDLIMGRLLREVPATASWVFAEASNVSDPVGMTALPGTALEAGAKIRSAVTSWWGPWPTMQSPTEGTTLGIAVRPVRDGNPIWLSTAFRPAEAGDAEVVDLPDGPQRYGGSTHLRWSTMKGGSPSSGPLWAWDWPRGQQLEGIKAFLRRKDRLADIDECWGELAWDLAHRIRNRSPDVQSDPVPVAELETIIAEVRRGLPDGADASVNGLWRLGDGEAFIDDLHRLGLSQLDPPWPAPDRTGSSTAHWWSTKQLLDRLHRTTRSALDVYRGLVDRHLPSMAAELPTYQLLPATIIGEVLEGDPAGGINDEPRFSWRVEPVESGDSNSSAWTLTTERRWMASAERWEEMAERFDRLRPHRPPHSLTIHGGEPEVFTSTPAGSLALSLLVQDLAEFKWIKPIGSHHLDRHAARPTSR